MRKCKTSELSGAPLDWAVAKIHNPDWCMQWLSSEHEKSCEGQPPVLAIQGGGEFSPSSNWEQGGPIMEKERISCWWDWQSQSWKAATQEWIRLFDNSDDYDDMPSATEGRTKLEAAMRCYVEDKAGEEVDAPQELYAAAN